MAARKKRRVLKETPAQRRSRERKESGTQAQQRRRKLKGRKGVIRARESNVTGFNLPFNTVVDPDLRKVRPFVQRKKKGTR